jgi:mono/diheme cytochrome c family protein
MTTSHTNTRHSGALTGLGLLALLAGLAVLPGCRGDRTDNPPRQFFPDMDDQPKLMPQTGTQFFEDGRSDRNLVTRTVPYGATTHDPGAIAESEWAGDILATRERLLRADQTYAFGLVAGATAEEPKYAEIMPVEVTRDLIIRGRERFDIYCSACHGYTGVGGQAEGSGTVGRLWSYDPANLMADLYRDRSQMQGTDGYLFHITRNGLKNPDGTYRMPGYAHAVNEADAWAIVAYVRTLQAAQGVPASSLDPADRARLTETGGNP